jgi:hypothetical protein
MARPKKLKESEVVEALKQSHGLKSGAAEILGVAYNTLDAYARASEAAKDVIEFWRIRRVDRAEYKLDEAIERAEPWAVALVLKGSKAGKDRGYGDRVDVTSDDEKIKGYIGFTPEQWDKQSNPVDTQDDTGE